MGTYVGESVAKEWHDNGLKVAFSEPSRETKGSWWEVYLYQDRLIACVMYDSSYVSCGEEISKAEIEAYATEFTELGEVFIKARES